MFKTFSYLHGGNGKYGLESDRILLNSANLLMIINGEHLGTGAGTNLGKTTNISKTNRWLMLLKLFMVKPMPWKSARKK